jgi:predicted ester cyclase
MTGRSLARSVPLPINITAVRSDADRRKTVSKGNKALIQHFVEDSIAERDKVAYRWTYRGTHQGELMGIGPTGKEVQITGITIDRISGGRVEEEWNRFDQLGMLQQLGVVPAPEH